MREVGADVEGEAVQGRPAAEVDADGADFAARLPPRRVTGEPDAGEALVAFGQNAKIGTSTDDDLFQATHVFVHIVKKLIQVQDWIGDQLAGAVVGDVSAPVDFMKGKSLFAELVLVEQEVVHRAGFTEGVHRRMLDKQQVVVLRAGSGTGFDQFTVGLFAGYGGGMEVHLQVPGFLVGHPMEVIEVDPWKLSGWLHC